MILSFSFRLIRQTGTSSLRDYCFLYFTIFHSRLSIWGKNCCLALFDFYFLTFFPIHKQLLCFPYCSRLGGDEFAVFLHHCGSRAEAEQLILRLNDVRGGSSHVCVQHDFGLELLWRTRRGISER